MNDLLAHLEAQLDAEEGFRLAIYDDATGRPFKKGDTLQGNLTVGAGVNLSIPFTGEEVRWLEAGRIAKGIALLQAYDWFNVQDDVRKTALGDLAYNLGADGLLHWPHFLSYMGKKDYPAATTEIRSNAKWISQVGPVRALRLETMIENGTWPTDIAVPGVAS